MDLGLSSKTVLVSGSTAGIGFAAALGLAREGAAVVVNGRTAKRVAEAVSKIQQETGNEKVSGVAADLGTAAGAAEVIRQVPTVDILVNNVGIFEIKPFGEITDEDWLSGVRLSRHYFPGMIAQNWGRIVFISSESAVNIPAEMIHYGMTKTAQLAVARGLAEMTVSTGVTVNSVLPGPTRSEGVGTFLSQFALAQGITEEKMEAEFFQNARPSSLIHRFASTDEVASMITFVCSEAASAVNGAALRVEGGVVRSIL